MDAWITGILLCLALSGIALLYRAERRAERKAPYRVGLVGLTVFAAAAFAYLMLTLLLVSGVQ